MLAIRKSDGLKVLDLLVHIFRILVIRKSAMYAKATGHFIARMLWHKETRHPIFEAFATQVNAFNEEFGEISLSSLKSSLLLDTLKFDLKQVSRLYVNLHQTRKIYHNFLAESSLKKDF